MPVNPIAEAMRPSRRYVMFSNTVMLLAHLAFAVLYAHMGARILFCYNLFSIAMFSVNYFFAWRRMDDVFYKLTYGEIFIFATLNLLLLGWDYGFQLYCFSYAITMQYLGFFTGRERGRGHGLLNALIIGYFVGMRLLLYRIEPMYAAREVWIQRSVYLSNAMLTLVLCINYSGLFTKMVSALMRDLHYSSTHDALTELYNRRHMWQVMDLNRSEGAGRAAVAMLDIDDFKRINDTYGHTMGDAVLRAMADKLRALEQEGVFTSRWGGEEFVIFCDGASTAYDRLEALLEDLVRRCAGDEVELEGRRIHYSVTVGLAWSEGGADLQDLVSRADGLLYEGKQAGKNRLVVEGRD